MGFAVQHHACRRGDFFDVVLSEIEFLCFCDTVCAGRHGIDHLTGRGAQCSVQRVDVLGCGHFIDGSRKPLNLVHGLIDAVCFGYHGEHLAGLTDVDNALLRHVGTLHLNDRHAAPWVEAPSGVMLKYTGSALSV